MFGGAARAALGLKGVARAGWARAGVPSPESVADHSYSVAVLSMLMADGAGLDACRAVRMALLHDLPEAATGDIAPGDPARAGKEAAERAAMSGMLAGLPAASREACASAWEEFLEGRTPEARLVREADKLEMALQAREYGRAGAAEAARLEEFVGSAAAAVGEGRLRRLMDAALRRGPPG